MKIRLIAHNSSQYSETVSLRSKILREPLGLEFSKEELENENSLIHIAVFDNDKIIGCLVLSPNGKEMIEMRQVAVKEDVQGQGIGQKLVHYGEKYAGEKGFRKMILNARKTAVDFYQKLGYEVVSDEFIRVTIPHYQMQKNLK